MTGVAADPDGDTLTTVWSGTGLVGDQPSFSGTLLPPVGVTAVSYTLTFTVSDNHAAPVSDDVVITVTDTTGPVLANVPASPLTATATSDAGANVPYGPVTASDLVDGARPVVCSNRRVSSRSATRSSPARRRTREGTARARPSPSA